MTTKGEEDIQAAIRETTYAANSIEQRLMFIQHYLEMWNRHWPDILIKEEIVEIRVGNRCLERIEGQLERMNAKPDGLPAIQAEMGVISTRVGWFGFATCILLVLILWRIW